MPDTRFFFPPSAEHLGRYVRITREWTAVRRHYDLLIWLQGEIQHYLPHEIMLAAWGNFNSNLICHDIVSALIGVRTEHSDVRSLSPLLQGLFNRWVELGRKPYALGVGESGFLLEERGLQCSLGTALQGMRSVLIHGISDKRGQHDCLYMVFSSQTTFAPSSMKALKVLLPYLDTALGQIDPMHCYRPALSSVGVEDYGLDTLEIEIMDLTKLGKTPSETAAILEISTFTVKNHLRSIFKKLHAYNRGHALSPTERGPSDWASPDKTDTFDRL